MPGVLEGIKVLDIASMWAAPLIGAYLADQGADVIKVEPPWGDQARRTFSSPPLPNGESRSWPVVGRGKKGVAVDISKPEGKEIVYALVERSDVLITNFRPAVARRLGYDYESLRAVNKALVYARVGAYGDRGPYAEKRGYDRIFQALSGMMRPSGPEGIPRNAGIWAADMSAPWAMCYGIALALMHREKTGEGQEVSTSLLHMSMAMQAVDLVRADSEVESGGESGEDYANQPLYLPYECSDGEWVNIVVISDKEFRGLCEALEITHVLDDPRFSTPLGRIKNGGVLFQVLAGVFSTRPMSEWLQVLEAHDVPCAPVLAASDVFDSPQVEANGFMTEVDYPGVGKTRMIDTPVRLSGRPGAVGDRAPMLGEHTEQVLKNLGYSQKRIGELEGGGVVLRGRSPRA